VHTQKDSFPSQISEALDTCSAHPGLTCPVTSRTVCIPDTRKLVQERASRAFAEASLYLEYTLFCASPACQFKVRRKHVQRLRNLAWEAAFLGVPSFSEIVEGSFVVGVFGSSHIAYIATCNSCFCRCRFRPCPLSDISV
jgi:hypothetical protein